MDKTQKGEPFSTIQQQQQEIVLDGDNEEVLNIQEESIMEIEAYQANKESSSLLEKVYLSLAAFGPLPSIFLYLFFPIGTVRFFGGETTTSSIAWCSIAASGSLSCAYVCGCALFYEIRILRILAYRLMVIYYIMHLGFFMNYKKDDPSFLFVSSFALIAPILALFAWGDFMIGFQQKVKMCIGKNDSVSTPTAATTISITSNNTSYSMSKWEKAFLYLGYTGPIPSIFLYIFGPQYAVSYFNGAVNPTSLFWCSLTASTDIVFVYVCAAAFYTKHPVIRLVFFRMMVLYAITHFGMFLYWHTHGLPLPIIIVILCANGLITSFIGFFIWGEPTTIFRLPQMTTN